MNPLDEIVAYIQGQFSDLRVLAIDVATLAVGVAIVWWCVLYVIRWLHDVDAFAAADERNRAHNEWDDQQRDASERWS